MQQSATSHDSADTTAWIATLSGEREATAAAIEALLEVASRSDLDVSVSDAVRGAIARLRQLDDAALAIATRYRDLLEAIPDAVTVHDERGEVIDANLAACRLYGHSREKLLGLNLHDLGPSLPPDHMRDVIETCRLDDAFTLETTVRRGDGRDFPVEMHSNTYLDGDRVRVLSVARGIGHWKRVADELHDAELRFHLLLHTIDKGVLIRDGSSGNVVYNNPALCRILRLTDAELLHLQNEPASGWRCTDEAGRPLPTEDLPSMRALRTAAPAESQLLCLWLPHLERPLWLMETAVPLFRRGEERPYQAVVTLTDVSDIKRTRDLFEEVEAIAHIGGYELVHDTGQVTWTPEIYRLFDVPIGTPMTIERVLSMFAPHSREQAQWDIESTIRGETARSEYEIVTALGRRRWILGRSRPDWRDGRIRGAIGLCQDITERKRLELELRRRAVTDSLTGLPNRESILEELERQIVATRDQSGPALLYVDLDRFKVINDILGARAGDQLLADAAERLRECLPANARCGRFAGDEFLVVLPRSQHEEQAAEVAETINGKFRRAFRYAGEEYVITASVGVARYPAAGRTTQQLLKHADAAMSEAKQHGRNTWRAFSNAIERRLERSLAIENQLRQALVERELRLAYQPQVDLVSGEVVGVEALLRWNHPERGELQPLAFVRHAESSGEIVPIGAWVIDEACRRLREWRDAGLPLRRIAVNVSYRQLLGDSFLESVVSALRRHELSGSALEIEMIERMLIEDTPDTMQMFKDLRDLGVTVTIDDFGEGYSSLNYLRRLPVDALKISCEFMRRVPTSAADAAICEAIIRVGHGLGLGMVAEGVETDEQRQFLLRHGLRCGQGHLFSPALDEHGFVEFARRHGVA